MVALADIEKRIRMDERIASAFSAWCSNRGFVEDRVVEALCLQAIQTLNSKDLARLIEDARQWKRIADEDRA